MAGDQSAACLAQVIFGHVGEEVYTEKRIYVCEILLRHILSVSDDIGVMKPLDHLFVQDMRYAFA